MRVKCYVEGDSHLSDTYADMQPKEAALKYVESWYPDELEPVNVVVVPVDDESRAKVNWRSDDEESAYLLFVVTPRVVHDVRGVSSFKHGRPTNEQRVELHMWKRRALEACEVLEMGPLDFDYVQWRVTPPEPSEEVEVPVRNKLVQAFRVADLMDKGPLLDIQKEGLAEIRDNLRAVIDSLDEHNKAQSTRARVPR